MTMTSFPARLIDLKIDGLPAALTRTLLEHFRIDSNHSNAFTCVERNGIATVAFCRPN